LSLIPEWAEAFFESRSTWAFNAIFWLFIVS